MSCNTLGSRLRQALADRGMSMSALSKQSGIPYSSVQNYVADKQQPGADALTRIRNEVGVSIDWLLTGDGAQFASGVEATPRELDLSDYIELRKRFVNFDDIFQFRDFWAVPGPADVKEWFEGQATKNTIALMMQSDPELFGPILGNRSINDLDPREAIDLGAEMLKVWREQAAHDE